MKGKIENGYKSNRSKEKIKIISVHKSDYQIMYEIQDLTGEAIIS